MFMSIRYSIRNPPEWALPSGYLYNRILDQIEWAEQAGFDRAAVCEHHFAGDGFLPSLLPMAAAIAARTKRILIGTEILLLPLHHPVRVAEDAAFVDIISGGRFELAVGAGYREEEYAGRPPRRRPRNPARRRGRARRPALAAIRNARRASPAATPASPWIRSATNKGPGGSVRACGGFAPTVIMRMR
jgi:alkanesulfonate monooxygenase SsuD/methylene tetrahydromethanopterin reductase-like flavin-dependent oxidoreductase (luciferase family)